MDRAIVLLLYFYLKSGHPPWLIADILGPIYKHIPATTALAKLTLQESGSWDLTSTNASADT